MKYQNKELHCTGGYGLKGRERGGENKQKKREEKCRTEGQKTRQREQELNKKDRVREKGMYS